MPLAFELLLLAGVGLLIVAALHDIAFRTVPNQLAAALGCCGLALRALSGDLLGALLAAVIVFFAAVFCWRRGWMGGGDVKLFAAAALIVPPLHVPLLVGWVSIAGGAVAVPYLLARRRQTATSPRPHGLLPRIMRAEGWRLRRGGPLPYAVAIAAGAGLTLLQGGAS